LFGKTKYEILTLAEKKTIRCFSASVNIFILATMYVYCGYIKQLKWAVTSIMFVVLLFCFLLRSALIMLPFLIVRCKWISSKTVLAIHITKKSLKIPKGKSESVYIEEEHTTQNCDLSSYIKASLTLFIFPKYGTYFLYVHSLY
jgi:hypothetical protein